VASEGRPWFKAFFFPQEKTDMRIRLLLPNKADAENKDANPAPNSHNDIRLAGEVFDFWSQPAGIVDICPASPDNIPSATRCEYIIKPRGQMLGWFRIELKLTINGREVTLKRKPGVENSAEDYDYLAFSRLPEPRDFTETGADMETPFGVMSALLPQTFCPVSAQVELTRASGASWAREIISWERVNPSPGKYDWSRRQQEIAMLTRLGLNIAVIIQRTPPWARPHIKDAPAFPEDLAAAFNFAYEAAATFGTSVKAWETWNEPDISHYATETPDRYAAMTKALSLGFSAGADSIGAGRPLVLLAAFARDPQAGDYAGLLKANEIIPYLDAYNFHTYHPVIKGRFQQVINTHLKTADMMGFSRQAIWLTETSLPYARNAVPKPMPAMAAQLRQLCETYMTAIQQDIKPVFWFIIRPYLSKHTTKPSQWGMVDSRLSPVPAYPAFAVMCRQLGSGRIAGSMSIGKQPEQPADGNGCYIFNDDGEEIGVVLPPRGTDEISLPPMAPGSRVFDVMGNEITFHGKTGTVSTHGYMVYVRNPGWSARPEFVPHGPQKTVAAARQSSTHAAIQRNIVLQPTYPQEMREPGGAVYESWDDLVTNWAPREYVFKNGGIIPVTLNIYNFGTATSRGKVHLHLPPRFIASENTFEVEVPAGQRMSIPLSVRAALGSSEEYQARKGTPAKHYWIWRAEFDALSVSQSVSRWTQKEN
jgi:hypothetical protein